MNPNGCFCFFFLYDVVNLLPQFVSEKFGNFNSVDKDWKTNIGNKIIVVYSLSKKKKKIIVVYSDV